MDPKILRHGEDNSAWRIEKFKKERKIEEEINIKGWKGMEFGDSLRVTEGRKRYKFYISIFIGSLRSYYFKMSVRSANFTKPRFSDFGNSIQ